MGDFSARHRKKLANLSGRVEWVALGLLLQELC